jgi:hypothetical protein
MAAARSDIQLQTCMGRKGTPNPFHALTNLKIFTNNHIGNAVSTGVGQLSRYLALDYSFQDGALVGTRRDFGTDLSLTAWLLR